MDQPDVVRHGEVGPDVEASIADRPHDLLIEAGADRSVPPHSFCGASRAEKPPRPRRAVDRSADSSRLGIAQGVLKGEGNSFILFARVRSLPYKRRLMI